MILTPGRIVHMTAFNDVHPDGDITMTYKVRKGDLFAFLYLGAVSDERKEKLKERAKVHKENLRRQAVEGPGAEAKSVPRTFPGPFEEHQMLPSLYRVLFSQLDLRRPQDLSVFELALNLSGRLLEMKEEDREHHAEALKREFPELLRVLKTETAEGL